MIRRATNNNLKLIDEINKKCLPENYDMDCWEEINKSGIINVATVQDETGEKIVGYIAIAHISMFGYEKKTPLGNFVKKYGDDCICIVSLAVLSDFRGKGFGDKLIKSVLPPKIKVARNVTLNVRISNIGAKKLYEKNGFIASEDIDVKYYSSPEEDAYLMYKLK